MKLKSIDGLMDKREKTELRMSLGYCLSDWLSQVVPFTGMGKILENELRLAVGLLAHEH